MDGNNVTVISTNRLKAIESAETQMKVISTSSMIKPWCNAHSVPFHLFHLKGCVTDGYGWVPPEVGGLAEVRWGFPLSLPCFAEFWEIKYWESCESKVSKCRVWTTPFFWNFPSKFPGVYSFGRTLHWERNRNFFCFLFVHQFNSKWKYSTKAYSKLTKW